MRRRSRAIGIYLLTTLIFWGCQAKAQEPQALRLVKTIAMPGVEGRVDHMSVDAEERRLFVAALGNSSVEVIDVEKGKDVANVEHIQEPQGIVYIPESKKLVVASGGDGKVRVYDHALTLVATLGDMDDADNARYDPQSRLVYVGYGSGALAVIDPEKGAKVADIKLDGHPESFRLETGGNRIFVNVPGSKEVEVVDRTKGEVILKWPLNGAEANYPMALDEGHHRLLVGCRNPAKMLVLDTETGKEVAEVDCVGDTDDLCYDAAGKRIYISGGGGSVTVVEQKDGDHYKVSETITTASGARTSLFLPDSGELIVAVPHRGAQPAEVRVYQVRTEK